VHSGQRLDQGGFAGPVLAHDTVDLPWQDLQVHAFKRLDAGKILGQSPDFEQRLRLIFFEHATNLTHYVGDRYKVVDFLQSSVIVRAVTQSSGHEKSMLHEAKTHLTH
jgi:hypothetical protein